MSRADLYMKRAEVEREEDWDAFLNVPKLRFPDDWEIQMVPPFGGALMRFWAWKGGVRVSVYFDGLRRLGAVDVPYWEIYPAVGGDCERFLVGEEAEMIEAIDASLNEVRNHPPTIQGREE